MNRGVKINNKHSVKDWDLVMSEKVINPPVPKTKTVEIEGGDGILDLSTALTDGEIKFKNRTIVITLTKVDRPEVVTEFITDFMNDYQGQRVQISFDEDPFFYYTGRATISIKTISSVIAIMTMTIDADPYKFKNDVTVVTSVIKGTKRIKYDNLRKAVTPVIKSTGNITLTFNDTTVDLTEGSFTIPQIQFKAGVNIITYSGNATVTVTYQEAGF